MPDFDELNFLLNNRVFFLKKEVQAELAQENLAPVEENKPQIVEEQTHFLPLLVVVEKLPLGLAEQTLLQNIIEKALTVLFPEGMKEAEITDVFAPETLPKRQLVLVFGTKHQEKMYELIPKNNTRFVYSHSLESLNQDLAQKKMLWTVLKPLVRN